MHRLLIPPVTAKAAQPKGTIYLYDAIGFDGWGGISEKDVVDALNELKASGCKNLEVRVNSPGGSVFSGLAMYEAIKNFDGKTECYVDGLAASAASFVMLAADKVHCTPSSMVMIHEASGVAIGNAKTMEETAAILRKANDSIVAIYTARTGMDEKACREAMAAETWMSGQEACDKGFCTDCIKDERPPVGETEPSDAASAVLASFKNTPPALKPKATCPSLERYEMRILRERLASAASGRGTPGQPGIQLHAGEHVVPAHIAARGSK